MSKRCACSLLACVLTTQRLTLLCVCLFACHRACCLDADLFGALLQMHKTSPSQRWLSCTQADEKLQRLCQLYRRMSCWGVVFLGVLLRRVAGASQAVMMLL